MLVESSGIRYSRIRVVIGVGVVVITFLARRRFIGSLDEFIEFTSVEPYAVVLKHIAPIGAVGKGNFPGELEYLIRLVATGQCVAARFSHQAAPS